MTSISLCGPIHINGIYTAQQVFLNIVEILYSLIPDNHTIYGFRHLEDDKMSLQGQTFIYKAISTLVVLLAFLAGETESTELSDNNHPTNVTGLPNITTLENRSFEEPHVLRMYKPCNGINEKFCENGGKCFIPQDTDTPSCMCPSGYSGVRCVHYIAKSAQTENCEKLIGIGVGVALLVCCLALMFYCCIKRRCDKPSPPYKVHGSENSV